MKEQWLLVSLVALVAALGLFYSFMGIGMYNVAGQAATQPVHIQAFPACIDTDLGFYPAQQGSTYDKYAPYDNKRDDYCKDPSTLIEYYCDEYGVNSDEISCPCQDGVCIAS
ncbi:MAG: hypothetical protein AABX70_00990 [Nanoarchaeota archaeon]